MLFATDITVTGPMRSPAQMLADQTVDGHASVHEGAAAASMGLIGAPIEGPTHFSQFDPLATAFWGQVWFERGCISSHFRTMVVEGEEVQASLTTQGRWAARIEAHKSDGTPVLVGTASIGPDDPETELDTRRATQGDPGELFVIDQLEVGMRGDDDEVASISYLGGNGTGCPFSLAEKLRRITEPHPWYAPEGSRIGPGQRLATSTAVSRWRRSCCTPAYSRSRIPVTRGSGLADRTARSRRAVYFRRLWCSHGAPWSSPTCANPASYRDAADLGEPRSRAERIFIEKVLQVR